MATPPRIDTSELARTAGSLAGRIDVASMPRLGSLLASDAGEVAWRVRGGQRERRAGGVDTVMHLSFAGELRMQCVRCLGEVIVPVAGERSYRLVATEEQAAREDLDDSEFDVLLGDRRFDLAELVEDELILALPPIARHANCSLPAGIDEAAADPNGQGDADSAAFGDRARPFAGLAGLVRRKQ